MNIVLIDDHTLFRSGLETMLGSLDPTAVIHSFGNCAKSIDSIKKPNEVCLVLLDYNIPGTSTVDNITSVRDHFENSKIVIVSGEDGPDKVITTIDLGASGFIPKSSEPAVLIAALKLVLAGGVYLPQQVLRYQISTNTEVREVASSNQESNNPLDKLTKRQYEVLMQVVDGKNNKNIAREIGLSLGTVKAHLSAAFQTLGVSNRTEAVVLASKFLEQ